MNVNPLVSIIVPCHNALPFLKDTVRSVLNQTYDNIELIVVDDASVDGSFSYLLSLENKRLKLFKQSFNSASKSRNYGYSKSAGDYILFLDADDLISSFHIESLLNECLSELNVVSMGKWDRFVVDPIEAKFLDRPTYLNCSGLDWLMIDWAEGQPMTQCGCFLIPRTVLESAGGWDDRLSLFDDFEFFTRVLVKSSGVRYANNAFLYYRSNISGSLSGRRDRKAAESAYLSLNLGVEMVLSQENSSRTRAASANILKTFDYDYFPRYFDLIQKIRRSIKNLGGYTIQPVGSPYFHLLRRVVGWQFARIIQNLLKWKN